MKTRMVTLSGTWSITKDPENLGRQDGWQARIPERELREITIPEQVPTSQWTMDLSYANVFPKYHGYVWYYKTIDVLPECGGEDRILLEFERAGYLCEVFVNGAFVGEHRDHEQKFCFDVTESLDPDGENLLAVRCFEPCATGREIDGIKLQEIPNSCFGNVQAHMLGSEDAFCLECLGGILGAVHLRTVPAVRVDDIYVRAFPETGEVHVTVSMINTSAETKSEEVLVLLLDKKSGDVVQELRQTAAIQSGASEVCLCGKIENHKLWELDSPILYLATVSIGGRDHKTVRFGFKDFRIQNGYFFLNGKRIFLKGAHSAISASAAITMKALGFNMIRTIARTFTEEALDVCDEIGLLVMDAAATAWGMTYHENTRRQMEEYNANMIRRHRNHPCIAAYSLFNELEGNPELFQCGVKALPKLRPLAPDTLFMLHSGRWDRDISLGSASNPGSDKWDTYLGAEGILDYPNRTLPTRYDGYQDPAMGDIHIYMFVPVMSDVKDYLRKIGQDSRPIFVSESGIGSHHDPMGDYLAHCNKPLAVAVTTELAKQIWDETEEFLDFYDLRGVYPLSCDFSRDTEKMNGLQRTLLYNIYRSNPMINGFSFTSFGVGHEGVLQGNLVIKDSLAYAIQQGHEPLRWSLFTSERTVYAEKPFEIEAVLCNEDFLAPGKYTAQAYIRGKDGCVWKKEFTVDYPENGYGGMPPLAVSALKEEVTLPAGEYVFSARLTQGGVAYDGDWPITVAAAEDSIRAEIAVCGISEKIRTFLQEHGVCIKELGEWQTAPKMVLVGTPESSDQEQQLHTLAEQGSNVVFLNAAVFEKNEALLKRIAGEHACVKAAKGTIYHYDHIAISHPAFSKIQDAGVLEFDRLGGVYPVSIFHQVAKPSKTVSAAIFGLSSFIITGLSLGEYAAGNGRYVLNSFRLEEAVNKHPYADMMLLNLIKEYSK